MLSSPHIISPIFPFHNISLPVLRMTSPANRQRTGVFGLFRTMSTRTKTDFLASGASQSEDAAEETVFQETSAQALKRKKTKSRAKRQSKNNIMVELQQEEDEMQRRVYEGGLTPGEKAFLTSHVRETLLELNNLPTTPHRQLSRGVVLFADISGFTALGKELRGQLEPLEAASKLAARIGVVLRELTSLCHEFEGDVAKFAGDALLCVWEGHEDEWMLERAKACAVRMLTKVKEVDPALDLHGGLAMGNLIHIHLGDKRHELLWYLVTGDAVIRAANLVEDAPRGHILYEPRKANEPASPAIGKSHDGKVESNETDPTPMGRRTIARLPSFLEREVLTVHTKTLLSAGTVRRPSHDGEGEEGTHDDGGVFDSVGRGTRMRTSTKDDPFLNEKITPRGRSYIPKLLRNVLKSGRMESAEMRNGVSVVFAALPELTLREEEIVSNSISKPRLDLLNETFADIAAIVRQMDGEIRDLLFDDKGCIVIAVFGAYGAIEMCELKALKAARRMIEELEVDQIRVGVSVGTCFVGLVGNDMRHDMIVMGHEVNMSARYMGKALPGTVLCGPRVYEATKEFYKFDPRLVELKKNAPTTENEKATTLIKAIEHNKSSRFDKYDNDLLGEGARRSAKDLANVKQVMDTMNRDGTQVVDDPNGAVLAYVPLYEETRRPSYIAGYRYNDVIPDMLFAGRKGELQKLQAHVLKALQGKAPAMCVVSGPKGYGKTWLLKEFRTRSNDKFQSHTGVSFELNLTSTLLPFRQILEKHFDLFEQMPRSTASGVVAGWKKSGIVIEAGVLESLFPYLPKILAPPPPPTPLLGGPATTQSKDRRVSSLAVTGMVGRVFSSMRFTSGVLGLAEVSENLDGSSSPIPEILNKIEGDVVPEAPPKYTRQASSNMGGPNGDEPVRRQFSSRLFGMSTVGSSRNLTENSPKLGSMSFGVHDEESKIKPEELIKKKMDLKKMRKMSRGNIIAMGKKELDPLVNFICSLLIVVAKGSSQGGRKGLVVVFEDVQWMDAISLQVLNDIWDRMNKEPKSFSNLAFVLSCRNADPDRPLDTFVTSGPTDMRPLLEETILDKARNSKLYLNLELDVLSRDECDGLVSKLIVKGTNDTVSADVLDAVYKNSGGMPNAIADVIMLIKEGGAVTLDPANNQWKWTLSSKDFEGLAVPGGQSVLSAARIAYVSRIDNLNLETRDYLKIAACTCDDKLRFRLQDIVDVIATDLESKSRYVKATTVVPRNEHIALFLQEAVFAGIVKNSRGFILGVDNWGFVSSTVLETVLDMVPADRREEIKDYKKQVDSVQKEVLTEGIMRDFMGGGV